MLLSFDIVPDAIAEHDDWHTHEHLPERLSIPGFVRGTRWVAAQGRPRYFVLYEVKELATLTSAAYLERLNKPSPWTAKMMNHYRGMTRGLCTVAGSFGSGMGQACLLIRFKAAPEDEATLRTWLLQDALPGLPSKAGLGCAHLFQGAAAPPMTNEQRIRGTDTGFDWAVVVTGYGQESVANLTLDELGNAQFERHGATGMASAVYRMDYAVTERDL